MRNRLGTAFFFVGLLLAGVLALSLGPPRIGSFQVTAIIGLLATLGVVWLGALWRRESVEAVNRRLRYSEAVADCAQILLRGSDDSALSEALERLLVVTRCESVFVERNIDDQVAGLSTSLVGEAVRSGVTQDPIDMWRSVPWSKMPATRAVLERGEPFAFDTATLEGEERELYERTTIAAELDIPVFSGGRWVGLVGFANDDPTIGWSDDEVALLQAVGEMFGAYWERQDVLRQLERLVVAKDDFVASVSHELRTPLSVVLGLARELTSHSGEFKTDDLEELMGLIAESATEVAALVDDLLVAARSDIDRITVLMESIDLAGEAERVISETATSPDHQLSLEVLVEGTRVKSDAMRLRQIIRNLIVNAVKYGGTDIRVIVDRAGDSGVVTVADSGTPIPDEDRKRIFDRYARGQSSATQPDSMGLGLYVAKTLVERMGGQISYSHDGTYSRFEVRLALSEPDTLEAPRARAS